MDNKLIENANSEITKAIKFLNENAEAFGVMNLKLYDASYYCTGREIIDSFPLCMHNLSTRPDLDYFTDFCDMSYNCFVEDLELTNNINFLSMTYHVGRTSSFYLHDRNIIDCCSRYGINYDSTIENLINKYIGYSEAITLKNGQIQFDENYRDDEIELDILDAISNDIVNAVKDETEDILIVYSKLKSFKDNQVELFKDYLANEEAYLAELKAEQDKQESEARAKIDELVTKYKITMEDLDSLTKNLKLI